MNTPLSEKIRKLAEERERLEREESLMREEAQKEIDQISAEIAKLEERREQLALIVGIEDTSSRAEHGQIQRLCLNVLAASSGGLSSGQVKDLLERQNPGVKLTSVSSTLSRLFTLGRIRRDAVGRYFLA